MLNYEEVMNKLEQAEVEFSDAEKYAKEMYAAAKELKQRVDDYKDLIKNTMLDDGVISQNVNGMKVSLRKMPVKVDIINEALVPNDFLVEKISKHVDKTALKHFLQENDVEWAKLGNKNEYSLVIETSDIKPRKQNMEVEF